MKIWAPPQNNFVFNQNGQTCYFRQENIGAWDMTVDPDCIIPHNLGADYIYITHISGTIRNDAGTNYDTFGQYLSARNIAVGGEVHMDIGVMGFNSLNIVLWRPAASDFNHVDYNDTGINRGVINIHITK